LRKNSASFATNEHQRSHSLAAPRASLSLSKSAAYAVKFVTSIIIVLAAVWLVLALTSRLLEPTAFGPPTAPNPTTHTDALVRVYAANVWGIRGRFAVHTWIATKAVGAQHYNIYQVIGWQLRRTGSARSITKGRPDRPWFGAPPILLHEVTGRAAEPLIGDIRAAAQSYPYPAEYKMLPGPNSNSFIQWILLEVPEIGYTLPTKAIGKNWMIDEYDVQQSTN